MMTAMLEVDVSAAILITECLQNDFVRPLSKDEPLPNLLHVGREEARRLMGENPHEGPVTRVMRWAYDRPKEELMVIHLRDWHDRTNPREKNHLNRFGPHCLAGAPGAEFVFDRPADGDGRSHVVNAQTLNDFHDTDLPGLLDPLAGRPVPIGLMGVWTEAKVTFLAYELATRYPEFRVAVCSALTAGSSRARHFLALDQMERMLGVEIFSSVGEFVEFLGGRARDLPKAGFTEKHPRLDWEETVSLEEPDAKLLRYVFRDCRSVAIRPLSGGFSGSAVLMAGSVDLYGHDQSPHVVKIGPQKLIGRERTAFERIEPVLGNVAPRIADFADLDGRGILKYRYASMGGGDSTTFQKRYMSGLPPERIRDILHTVFSEQLGRLYAAAVRENFDLLDYYRFSPEWAPSVRRKVKDLLGPAADEPVLSFPGWRETPNVCLFYEERLPKLPPRPARGHYFTYVHGDLNGANIVLDGRNNVWLIDFFHTHRGHVLCDLIKLENDLLYIFTPLTGETDCNEALRLTDYLMAVTDLSAPLPDPRSLNLTSPAIRRAYETVRFLRSFYPALVREDTDPFQVQVGQLRYAVHTLSFYESSDLQKRWALYTASRAAALLVDKIWHGNPLRVDGLDDRCTKPGRMGLTLLPGRRDYGRDLNADLASIRRAGVTHILSLITDAELQHYGVPELLSAYEKAGFTARRLSIPDQRICTPEEMNDLAAWFSRVLNQGGRIMIHCAGGLGRSGAVAAGYLKTRGLSTEDAVTEVRRARSPRAIESLEQMDFVRSYPGGS